MSGINKLGVVVIPTADQDQAIAWYREKLGFELVADVPYGDGSRWVVVGPAGGGASISLGPSMEGFEVGRRTGIGFETKDAKALHAELSEKGVAVGELIGGDGTVPLLFFFEDGDGNGLMVAEVGEEG